MAGSRSSSANKGKSYDDMFKLVLIGDTGVGKSCLLLRFADDTYTDAHISTIGVDFRFRNVKVDKRSVKLQIWDTAGQERFRTITSAYYRGAHGIVMVYDVTSEESFNHIQDWFTEVDRYAQEGACKLIVGHKCDRADKAISTERAKAYADSYGIPIIETSAVDSVNIEECFLTITKDMMKFRKEQGTDRKGSTPTASQKSGSANLKFQPPKRKGSCC